MRLIKINFRNRSNLYIRRASREGDIVEIQGQYGGIILERPVLRRTVRHGVILVDHGEHRGITAFNERTHGYESNSYTSRVYQG